MIAFGCPITDSRAFTQYAQRGIELAKEPDSVVFAYASSSSIFRTYNLYLDLAKKLDDLEALVLVHQDAELVDPDFCAKIRQALQDPEVALVGCGGSLGVRSIAWWEGAVTWSGFTHRFQEHGGGEIPALSWDAEKLPSYARLGEVDAIDGFVMALSPWAVRELRFDEALGRLHGYDFDLCCQARAAGKKVVTADFRAIHHHSLDMIKGIDGWVEAHIKVAEKWDGRIADVGSEAGEWKQRARRAEAELAAQRMVGFAVEHVWNARVEALRSELRDTKASTSWRWTTPLRALGRLVRGRSADADEQELGPPERV